MSIAVIGGGAAGLFAAGVAASRGANVALYEKNDRFGVKLRITGKGRCNLTNDCERREFFDNVVSNPEFMYSSYAGFDSRATMEFFEGRGVPLKVERGRRVFPVSDKAADIAEAMIAFCREGGVKFCHGGVLDIEKNNDKFTVIAKCGEEIYDSVIIATGGRSYSSTGSNGDGYRFAKKFGHTIIAQAPSLVPLVCTDSLCADAEGLSLKNVALTVKDAGTPVFSELGEMLFTSNGVSGPLVLSASAVMRDIVPEKYTLYIDLKPALDYDTLDKRLLSDFSDNINRNFGNSLSALLPAKLIMPIITRCGIPPEKKVNSITAQERRKLLETLKKLRLDVISAGKMDEAIITRGGVSTKEINPKTMQSKLVSGLYFAGEVIDVDAYTGGYNLQIAFSTAYAAAKAAADNQ